MKQRPRRYISDSEMALIWDRWRKGDTLNAIARDLDRGHSAVQGEGTHRPNGAFCCGRLSKCSDLLRPVLAAS